MEGSTSLDLATSFGNSKLVQMILDRSQPSIPHILRALHTAAINCYIGCVRILLCRLAVQSCNGNFLEAEQTVINPPEFLSTPFLFTRYNRFRRVKRNCSLKFAQKPLDIALHLAANCFKGSFWVIDELLKCGANLEARSNYGETPLYLALFERNLYLAVTLIFAVASVNSLSGDKYSPVQLAVSHCTRDIVFLLHKFGAR